MILLTTLINFGILDYERHKGVSQNPSWFIQKILRARCLRDIFAKPIMKAKSRIRKKYAARKKSYSYTPLVILASSFILSGSVYCYGLFQNNEGTGSQPVPIVHAEVRPSPTPILVETTEIEDHSVSQKVQILSYIVEVFGEDAADAITIIRKCENSAFNPEAENWNNNGTWDAGIFQVNQVHGYTIEEMKDWKKNIDAAYKIFKRAGNKWTPWSCAHVIGQKPFYEVQ